MVNLNLTHNKSNVPDAEDVYPIRSILHDPAEYPDPFEFKPERFLRDGILNREVQDPGVACFGFGRRVCAGRGFAKNSLFSMIASTLHVFNITPALDESGKPINVEPVMTSGIISSVAHNYPCISHLTDHFASDQDTPFDSLVQLSRDRPRLKR